VEEAAALAVDREGGPVEALAAAGREWGVEVPEAQDRGWEAAAQADLDHRPEAGARADPAQEWEAVARGVRVQARDQAKPGRHRVANQGVAQPNNKMLRSRHPRGWRLNRPHGLASAVVCGQKNLYASVSRNGKSSCTGRSTFRRW
jgi:hypothetical protein